MKSFKVIGVITAIGAMTCSANMPKPFPCSPEPEKKVKHWKKVKRKNK